MLSPDKTYLFLDASSVMVQAGLWRDGRWLAYRNGKGQALESIFTLIDSCLEEARIKLEAVGGFIHGEGPGSVLGIRLAAMAIRGWLALPAWQRATVHSCRSLPLAAVLIREKYQPDSPFHVVAEARQTRWNLLRSDSDTIEEAEPATLEALLPPLYHLRQRKAWNTPPAHAVPVDNSLMEHPELLNTPGLLSAVEQPGLYLVSEQTFRTWTPERHRASPS